MAIGYDTEDMPEATPMRDHLELELKWALTADEHARVGAQLSSSYSEPHVLMQGNSFYDSADRHLRAVRMNLRIRAENQRFVLTCKHKAETTQVADGLSSHREWEDELPAALIAGMAAPDAAWTAALPLPLPIREALGGQTLHALGGFANRRLEWQTVRAGVSEVLCLDDTTFGERHDYELEIETNDPLASADYWRTRFAEWQVPVTVQTLTKFARFLATMR
jgi:uncharacterized protein YjbK